MKTKLQSSIRNIFIIILLFAAMATSGQSRQEKTLVIIDSMKIAESMSFVYSLQIDELKALTSGEDSIRLLELEKKFLPDSIAYTISTVFNDIFSEEEINVLFDFVQSTAFAKLMISGRLSAAITEKYQGYQNELDLINENSFIPADTAAAINTFQPIPVNRKNGFYEVADYKLYEYPEDVTLGKKPALTFDYIEEVLKEYSIENNQPEITIRLNKEGAQKFYELTKKNIGRPIAIVVDKYIVSMPNVQIEIPNGKLVLSGQFTEEETDRLIKQLREE